MIGGGYRSFTVAAMIAAALTQCGAGKILGATFSDITSTAGIDYFYDPKSPFEIPTLEFLSGGAAAGDYDNDGFADLYVTRHYAPDILYRNNGNGTFSDATSAAFGALPTRNTNGVGWGDIDNDGDLDLYASSIGQLQHFLYINDGAGHFTEEAVARGAGVGDGVRTTAGTSVSFGDYDNDGWLDLYVGEWNNDESVPVQARLLRNLGSANPGHFEDTTDSAGVNMDLATGYGANHSFSFTPRFADFDRDGHQDIAVASDFHTSRMFWNNGDGTFTDGSATMGVTTGNADMGFAVGDVNGDGLVDWFNTDIYVAPSLLDGNRLFLNNGDRTFTDATTSAGVRNAGYGWGTDMLDYDNDGDLDIIATNGYTDPPAPADRVRFFENDGSAVFTEKAIFLGITNIAQGRGLLTFDFDNDGDIDTFIVNNHQAPVLYRNNGGNANDWLNVRTIGTISNAEGVGAFITVTPNLDQPDEVLVWEITGSSNYLAQSEKLAHFGLGPNASAVDVVTIEWPASGIVQQFFDVAPNQLLTVVEPLPDYNSNGLVDTADYVVWRKFFGAAVPTGTNGDGNGDGVVDDLDYALWHRANGKVVVAGAGAASGDGPAQVPEPTNVALWGLAIVASWAARPIKRRRNCQLHAVLAAMLPLSLRAKTEVRSNRRISMHPHPALSQGERVLSLLLSSSIAACLIFTAGGARADDSIARLWNEQLLDAIRHDTARPTVHARNLYHLSAAMYDAWAAYETVASQVMHPERSVASDINEARRETISFAAYNITKHRFVSGPAGVGPGRDHTEIEITLKMLDLGYDPLFTSTVGNSPAALGNRIAQTVINNGLADGANELNNYAIPPGAYTSVNPPLTFENPGTVMNDPSRWQALHFVGGRIDQFGRPINESTQRHLTPFWGDVKPFAMTAADRSSNGVYHDQGLPPGLDRPSEAQFKEEALVMIRLSAELDPSDGVMMDISPATRGNTPESPFTNSYDQLGYTENPYTGLPYEPQLVQRGDFGRVTAEFWADGPLSSAPPGHWNEISNHVSDKMDDLGIPKQIGGRGPVTSDLEFDIKRYLALNGGLHDAAIAAWNHKGFYDSARPVSFIRYMGQLGQSSDPGGPSYHPDGLPLEAGLVEVITAATTAVGERHEHLAGHEGKVAVRSWQGAIDGVAPFDDPSELGGVGWILAENWMPYQLISFVTPPFAGYVSGHSTYSRSAAEILTLLTGDPFFPGGMFEYHFEQGSGLDFEYGPMEPMSLQWATYFDASDQASLSRIYGGIHPPADDFPGRRIGHEIGSAAWLHAQQYFLGVPEPGTMTILVSAVILLGARRSRGHSASASPAIK